MKSIVFVLCMLILPVGLCLAQEVPVAESQSKYVLEYDLTAGAGIGKDCSTDVYWKSGFAGGFGVNLLYPLDPRVVLRAGVSEQYYSANRYVEHPFPYVMDLRTYLSTIATRLSIGTELIFPRNAYHGKLFVGTGVYGDIVHYAQADVKQHYISHTGSSSINVESALSGITPGFMANAGFYANKNRLELRYTQDWKSFEIKGIPVGKQRRSSLMLNWAINPW